MRGKSVYQPFQSESFINFCFKRDAEDILYWEKFLQDHPEHKREAEEQRLLNLLLADAVANVEIENQFLRLNKRISHAGRGASHLKIRFFTIIKKLSVAACLVGFAFVVYHLYQTKSKIPNDKVSSPDISPGGNRALLILSSGKQINLGNLRKGTITEGSKNLISKVDDGHIIYSGQATPIGTTNIEYNTIVIPKGGQYNVRLPDGTEVWLNADSKLKFPTSFAGLKKREVELSGEAFFEVKHDQKQPFIVVTSLQKIEDVGTQFNVRSYENDPSSKTTLLEGIVKVNHQMLKPGEQGEQSVKGGLKITAVNTDDVVAWKNGYFNFNNESITNVMQVIARWYDVDVDYQGNITKDGFVGKISRYKNISEILKRLESTGLVHFKIDGRRVIVMQ